MKIQSYKELIVWQKAMDLVETVYVITKLFPKEELFVLVSQIRRAAISIPSNIAEGYGRRSYKEYLQFFSIAYGSALELETQLLISDRLKYLTDEQLLKAGQLMTEINKMLYTMIFKRKEMISV